MMIYSEARALRHIGKLPNELITEVFQHLDVFELSLILRALSERRREYKCALFVLLGSVEIYCQLSGHEKRYKRLASLLTVTQRYKITSASNYKWERVPVVTIYCENLPRIAKYQAAIKKIVIYEKKDEGSCRDHGQVDKRKLKIIQLFLKCCTRVKEIEVNSHPIFRFPECTQFLRIINTRFASSFSIHFPTHLDKVTIALSNAGIPQNIRKVYIETVRLCIDQNFRLSKLTDLEIQCKEIGVPSNGVAFSSDQFPSLEKLKFVATTNCLQAPLVIDLKTLKTLECSFGRGYSDVEIIHPGSISSFTSMYGRYRRSSLPPIKNAKKLVLSHCSDLPNAFNLEGINKLEHLAVVMCKNGAPQSLQYCKNLKTLDLSSNSLLWISQSIQALQNLVSLNLEENRISKIENLESLTKLEWLSLKRNKIEILEGLKLPKLKYLSVSENLFCKIQNLQDLRSLEGLSISSNHMSTDFEGLYVLADTLTSFSCLNASYHPIFVNLARLPKLNSIKTYDYSIRFDRSSIFPNLEELSWILTTQKTLVSNVDLSCIKELKLTENQIVNACHRENMPLIGKMTSLEVCCLTEAGISDVSYLATCTKLRKLDLSHNMITSFNGIQNLRYLESLDISKNQLDSLQNVVVNWPSMTYFNLSWCEIVELPTFNTPKLSRLLLEGDKIYMRSLLRLRKIKSLRYLALDQVESSFIRAVGIHALCSEY
ncbi:hypothetical protein DASC09_037240 [Saccharomycopsis crataegensis]|uniref:F-box domain-containing protein n=1 Tax=Saccharomycopsis crataegensis TaxID=43959 RepID=A0AAV5QNS6_9ASCO|nr:hypothetical protein DASC09_037240 [Saccharomycopsis crataegensis]